MLCDMDARIFGFDRPEGGGNEHRREERLSIATVAKLRDRHSNKYDVRLLDLSVTGFRAEAHYALDAGQIVWLTIPGMQGLEATVAWRRGIERKLGILRETYAMLNSEAQAGRMELLELIIVMLIFAELALGIFGHS